MKFRTRTWAAALLSLAMVVVPCGAWYLAGSRHVRQEAAGVRDAAIEEARTTAIRLAERIAFRLSNLQLTESRRPVEHYQHPSEVRSSACPCAESPASPLASGLADHLVRAHFQIDGVGRVSLPALASGVTEAVDRGFRVEQEAVYESLECAATEEPSEAEPLPAALPAAAAMERRHRIGEFAWRTVPIDGDPTLVAVREVATPGAVLTQGFIVSREALDESLRGSAYPARIVAESDSPTAARIPIESATWFVELDSREALAQAEATGRELRGRFHRVFLLGALLASVAGVGMVALVGQSERLARQRSRFAAAAAHELRTPLAGMRLYGEMLAEGIAGPEKVSGYSRRIVDEAGRLGRVVNNVLGYSRLERGALTASADAKDLGAWLGELVDAMKETLNHRGATVELRVEPDLPAVRFNRDAVAQIVHNLVDNAEKYTREAADRTIVVSLAREAHGVRLNVADRGPGVPAELRRRVFRPFSRGESPDAPAGIGLGLAMVRALADAHRASVSYDDREGGGASFSVVFPV